MRLQILVVTMNRNDLGLVKKMNIRSDVLIANQTDRYDYLKEEGTFSKEMVSTSTRCVSINRNLAITCSSPNAEYIMFLDDDIVLNNDYLDIINNEFNKHPYAEAIKFSLSAMEGERHRLKKPIKFCKANRKLIGPVGVVGLVIRKDVLEKYNLFFNQMFGPGTENYCGEDTLFLSDMLRKKVNFYFSPLQIGIINSESSSWYEGFTERFFYVKGKVLCAEFGKTKANILAHYFAFRNSRRKGCAFSYRKVLNSYRKGIKDYSKSS